MIRFYDGEVHCVEYDRLDSSELYAFFVNGHQEDMVCVLNEGRYVGNITYTSFEESEHLYGSIREEYLILDEGIWKEGREYFVKHRKSGLIPVLSREHHLLCYAWQDEEANRELRMLRELEDCNEALDFQDLYPDCAGVMIHGFNELAWYFAKYLIKRGLAVNVDGELWQELGTWEEHEIPVYRNYEIWAEGIQRERGNWQQEQLRSASVEFECVNEIYEANIKAGKITDADGSVEELLDRLRKEKEIVIRGTGTKAQDAYDWLLSNGIDICAFQSGKADEIRKSLFGRPIVGKSEIMRRFGSAVIIECSSKYSAWGFGDVDTYEYEGYERNRRYILLRDYIEVPENDLSHILAGKKLVLAGDIRLCNRASRWWNQRGTETGWIKYWDILKENEAEIEKIKIPEVDGKDLSEDVIYILLTSEYAASSLLTRDMADKHSAYIRGFKENGIYDFSDYFSDTIKSIHMESSGMKYRIEELCPYGILLGAIPAYSGNVLIRESLAGHPNIIMIEGGKYSTIGVHLCINLYSICIRLAEEESDDILSDFWLLYLREVGEAAIERDFPDKDKFHCKLRELLKLSDRFTSQELFIIFHIAYEAMYGREILNLKDKIIYWEPHCCDREIVREWAYWLGSKEVKGFTLCTVRNRFIRAGSFIKTQLQYGGINWKVISESMLGWDTKHVKTYEYWDERTVKFEELKCSPKETLTSLCEWWGIPYNDSLLETTYHGKKAFYGDITGFDIKPAYNLYEEYFTIFDRMRISLIAGSYQKRYGYPYVSCLNFSRRELQEMFLKDFRWEATLPGATEGKNEESIKKVQKGIRHLLWLEHFAETLGIEINETYGILRSYKP